MSNFSIAMIPGDGVGREVTPVAFEIARSAAADHGDTLEPTCYEWGSDYYLQHGIMMPPDGVEQLKKHDAILLGAVGHPKVPDHITLNGLLLPIRRELDLFANVRPAILYTGVESPLKGIRPGDIDIVVVRENTEGEYSQVGGFVYEKQVNEVAVQTAVFTRRGVERIIRFAFDLAQRRNQKQKVTSVTKSNAQGFSMVLWDRVFDEVAQEYDGVETESLLVDAAALNFVRRPQTFDVVVGSNLFGDILSDLSAMVAGGIGLAASANVDPLRRCPSMFEPVHGTAPDIAGKGVANPMAMIFSAVMMLDHLGLVDAATRIDRATQSVIAEGKVRTADLGGNSSTSEVADAVLEKLEEGA
ncbi:MAG: tartrate dehydrogenase [Acidobacteriaceae bacterium]|nr:tartrate dehydrogenase [Acidobacteriaceae bacterium]